MFADRGDAGRRHAELDVVLGPLRLPGVLTLPRGAVGLVLFAHGSGSSRLSPRNRTVAAALNERGIATLLFDLLSEIEAADRRQVFDVALLAGRLAQVSEEVRDRADTRDLPVGYFGASTGAAAAIRAATATGSRVAAVVSRGGRPDLAGDALELLHPPTLLVVGARDEAVLALTREAVRAMRCAWRIEVVPGATHLFEEPGALQAVAELAASWFLAHFPPRAGRSSPLPGTRLGH